MWKLLMWPKHTTNGWYPDYLSRSLAPDTTPGVRARAGAQDYKAFAPRIGVVYCLRGHSRVSERTALGA